MARSIDADFDRSLRELGELGLLLDTDKAFPSLTGLMIAGPIRGSWWAHPLANHIYMVGQKVMRHADVLMLKLLSGKLTYVHRPLWPEVLSIAAAREAWQMDELPAPAKSLLGKVDERGSFRVDELRSSARSLKELGADARTLEARLLVFGDDVHTESGAHVKRIETWEHWAENRSFAMTALPGPSEARARMEQIVADINAATSADARLPWQMRQRSSRRRANG